MLRMASVRLVVSDCRLYQDGWRGVPHSRGQQAGPAGDKAWGPGEELDSIWNTAGIVLYDTWRARG